MLVDSTGNQRGAVVGAIRNAAQATGADFQYLLATAQVESGLDPRATVSSSSAKGLFQFIDHCKLAGAPFMRCDRDLPPRRQGYGRPVDQEPHRSRR